MSWYQPTDINPPQPGAWTPGMPTEPGVYWLYGYAFKSSETPELMSCAVQAVKNGVVVLVNGQFADRPGRLWHMPAAVPDTGGLCGGLSDELLSFLHLALKFRAPAIREGGTWTYAYVHSFQNATLEQAQTLGLVSADIDEDGEITALTLTPEGRAHLNV